MGRMMLHPVHLGTTNSRLKSERVSDSLRDLPNAAIVRCAIADKLAVWTMA